MTLGGKQTPPRVEIIELREASLRLLARQTTARLRFLAAIGSFGAALLNGGTTALILGAALQALLAAAKFGVGHATGRFVLTASKFFCAAAFRAVSRLDLLGN